MSLAPLHMADLKASGLSDPAISALGFESIRPADIPVRNAESAYSIPYFNLDGSKNCFTRAKLVPPVTDSHGHKQKYWQKHGSHPELYLPPIVSWRTVAKNPKTELTITEGEKKSAAACERGLITAGIGGVWNWTSTLDNGNRLVLPMLDEFIWTNRSVMIVPDSDGWHDDEKGQQIIRGFFALAKELQQRGAEVRFVILLDPHGVKCGLDDWLLVPGHDVEHSWPKLERIPLDAERFNPLTSWWQRWREKWATQEAVRTQTQDALRLDEVAGMYTIHSSTHSVTLVFDRLQEQRGSIHAELAIMLHTTELLSGVDVALKSDTAQTKLAQSLKTFSSAVPWKVLLQRACALVLKRYRAGDPGIILNRDTPLEHLSYSVNPLVFHQKTTILYGDGGLGKSTLALLVAMLVSNGLDVAGLRAILGRALYLDYEDSSDVHARRLHALQSGQPELADTEVHYQRCVEPLTRLVSPLIRQIQADRITFIVLDSILAATGGDSSAEATAKLFAALRTLNVSCLAIGHVPKTQGEGQAHPTVYGSVFNQNFSRMVWEVKKEQEVGEGRMVLGLFNRKSNLSRLHHPIGLSVDQQEDGSRIHFAPYDLTQAPVLAAALPAPAQIRNFLEDGTLRTAKAIAEGTGLKLSTVTSTLSRDKGRKWQMFGGAGQETLWAVTGSK